MSSKIKLVIIGNGMVGHRFIEDLVDKTDPQLFDITVFCEEPRVAYDRVHLSSYFSHHTAAELSLVKEGFYQQHGINILIGERAININRENQVVYSSSGREVVYDKLILATGSYPWVPPIQGNENKDCFVYRTIEDLKAIEACAKKSKSGVVVGGGLLGLEAAGALKALGMETHVIEFAPVLMAEQLDLQGGLQLRNKIERMGVQVHTSKNTKEIVAQGQNARNTLNFADGTSLEVDFIVFSTGIRPQDKLARQAKLDIAPRGGIAINDVCQSSDPNIYAIGECASWNESFFGLVAPGYKMATVAVDHLLNRESVFEGADMSAKLKLLGVNVGSIGDANGRTPNCRSYVYLNEAEEVYKRLIVSEDGKKLLGAVLVGDTSDYGDLLQLTLNDIELPEHPDSLILPAHAGAEKPALGADALPDSAVICSCFDVTKSKIAQAVAEGNHTLADIKAVTGAGTGCGGCIPLVTSVLNAELTKSGIEVNHNLCEHFPYSRQEMFHLIRIEGVKSFEEMLEKHGKGYGCETCKPAIGSILASCWGDHVLKPQNVPLQDTNDNFLGNLQKDGTYSVIPRMAGGEVTPLALAELANVARDYNLYTKITGAQRIGLFGAQKDDLPAIWQRLIDAGFETGQAYAKALRMAKTCVGSTWCRFGVQDSVGLGSLLENRYKGIRTPHKMKFGVSGCTRECAEAQGKDLGIIATDAGWNMYVCGNGGMKPRHADLLAADLDQTTLLQYIDRFMMFYIRTADKLQRTSVWLENMEGGIDYLREVIVNDSLGINKQLEADVARLVENYRCEWTETLQNPQQLKRFSHFINSDQRDDNVVFVPERDQHRPATYQEKHPQQQGDILHVSLENK
ncbi:nitrite reductase large subunit [Photobacterium damselae subsp. damselae]|uniref:nitrite reductase large subunit NirB n=1 Tax=Photobacterium damselae TaxID=38293 RepID=UPI0010FEA84B|nr:nitrite reductase large subunit NirB [Photobacterium damselae]MBA5683854.1 nitrite reductase large subunit [Photobacterium damselae subsp. damselae]NVH52911.1 nitrite reductase large subunit [Photobacterium damselae subsp. damselae]NVO80678.1 nitrite reductase large subunit [Photobacterium damselae subsp. damselae]TLS82828.1 nitrite reductase large subunit [Photobacterium damselae subsp. damselae]TLS90673.1 nitrite reductase large subunit [Photobacterium damselae subsp. damselae]